MLALDTHEVTHSGPTGAAWRVPLCALRCSPSSLCITSSFLCGHSGIFQLCRSSYTLTELQRKWWQNSNQPVETPQCFSSLPEVWFIPNNHATVSSRCWARSFHLFSYASKCMGWDWWIPHFPKASFRPAGLDIFDSVKMFFCCWWFLFCFVFWSQI